MPSDQELRDLAEDWKTKGNEAFQKSELESAVQAYSQGLVQVDRIIPPPVLLKATLLSNRAACYLKQAKLQECVDDCGSALTALEKDNDTKLRAKLLYRRAKALFMNANMPHKKKDDDLQLAAKDLLTLLSFDSSNKEATHLLNTVRAQHAAEKKGNASNSPLAKQLESIKKKDDKILQSIKVLLGMLSNDNISASMEFGRLQGVNLLLDTAKDESLELKIRYLSLQCLSCAGSHPPFCRTFMKEGVQTRVSDIIKKSCTNPGEDDIVVGALTLFLRLILHLDRDDPDKEIVGVTYLEYEPLISALVAAFKSQNVTIIRAAADVLSTLTAGADRDAVIIASLDNYVDLPLPLNKFELHQLTPKQSSDYKQRQYHKKTRDEAWAFERSTLFCNLGGLENLLQCAVACQDVNLRREITVVMGKLLAALDAEDKIKDIVRPFFGSKEEKKDEPVKSDEKEGVVIEEITEEEEEKEGQVVEVKDEEVDEKPAPVSFESMMERTELATALLMAKSDMGVWAMGSGWPECESNLVAMVDSNDKNALCLVAEFLSAAASVKDVRPIVSQYLTGTNMKLLVAHDDRDVRTAAASSVAKLGLAEQATDEFEIMGLLEAACYMLEDQGSDASEHAQMVASKVPDLKKGPTTSLERGVEVMAYLASKTMVKEELASGFQATPESKHTGLELLVQVADMPGTGASLLAFGLASIFQLMAVTPLTLRKEGFEGKQITMEQYDEIQNMQKTEEQKDFESKEPELLEDNPEQCSARIRKLASTNVPRALTQLTQGASDQTLEQAILALNRMADESSVRGSMIQQGVLSTLIKLEKEEKNPSDVRKNILRMIRHCMSRLLVTTNPTLLTSAQRMGAIKPLIQLVREVESTELQKFEALLALTNLASAGDDTKNKIVAEKGLSSLKFAMFSDHDMVKTAATEALCNLVPNEKFMLSLREEDEMRLWLALAADYEANYQCARAAAGCLAMATGDPEIASTLIGIKTFKERMDTTLESGSLEIMHRMLVVVLNLAELGGKYREAAIEHGLIAFARAYVDSYHDGTQVQELEFGDDNIGVFNATVDVAKQIVKACDNS